MCVFFVGPGCCVKRVVRPLFISTSDNKKANQLATFAPSFFQLPSSPHLHPIFVAALTNIISSRDIPMFIYSTVHVALQHPRPQPTVALQDALARFNQVTPYQAIL